MIVETDVIVVGGGAAGLFTAAIAGQKNKKVLLFEHNATCGKKIRISGGGRCNFTNIHTSPENFISQNPHFCRSALKRYTPYDFIDLVEKYNIAYHEKTLGQLFCDHSAQEIISMLESECTKNGVTIQTNVSVQNIEKIDDNFIVFTSEGDFKCKNVVIASGGLSIPPLGTSDLGYTIAKKFGHKIIPCVPALVPLVIDSSFSSKFSHLSGISFDSIVSFENVEFRENTLITHKGVSGPAILQISSYTPKEATIEINIVPELSIEEFVENFVHSAQRVKTILQKFFPSRFVQSFISEQLQEQVGSSLSIHSVEQLYSQLQQWKLPVVGTLGFAKAEVTKGGVSTKELSSKTMESNLVPGLFFVGEVVDVTGHLGGFNFQWAWSSGFACGTALQ